MSGTLHPGGSLAHYRVISPLGAGGMGEVYMAQDEKLERAVALKILPPELVKNEERLRRFVQEAKSASSLSHPHIVTIYEIGQAHVRSGEGAEEEIAEGPPIHFIAMELISGETLKQKIHGEKEDLRALLRYLSQAAEGLAKAHGAGIVHRDLKPENIMISRDGYAKVLDFGLAKLTERQDSGDEATSLPTSTRDKTLAGAVMGTVGYMSPEQARGKSVDHRSDIFSFGCMLYEAATRRRPFTADSKVETMHKIIHEKPEPVEELNPETPNAVRRLIRRCLAKSPDQRFHSMKDLALELNEIVEEYESLPTVSSTRGSGSSASAPALASSGQRNLGFWVGLGFAGIVAVAGIAFGIYGLRQRTARTASAAAPFQSMSMRPLTSSGNVRRATLSPDGKYLVNAIRNREGRSLWVKQVATGSDVQIVPPLPNPFRGLSFSLDGNYVYYVNQETGGPGYSILYQVPVLGGEVRKLLFDVDTAVTLSPDGKQLAFLRGYPQESEAALMIANADGTGERKLAVRKDPEPFPLLAPSWSPDGRTIAAIAWSLEGVAHQEVVAVDVADGSQTSIGGKHWFDLGGVAWLPDGTALVLTGSDQRGSVNEQVWLLSYPDGEAHRITNDLNDYAGVSVTHDGSTLATIQGNRVANLWVVPVEDAGEAKQLTFGSSRQDAVGAVRAASSTEALFMGPQSGSSHMWRISIDSGSRTRLTPDSGVHYDPAVSRDGSKIAFASVGSDGISHLWAMNSDGGNLVQVTHGEGGEHHPFLSPDGRWLLHASFADRGLYKVDLQTGTSVRLTDDLEGNAVFSPDGKRIAYDHFMEVGGRLRRSVSVIPSEGGSPTHTLPWTEGFDLRWTFSGDALTFQKTADGVGNVWRMPLDGTDPEPITDFKTDLIFSYDWSPDGKLLFMSRGNVTSDVVLISDFR